MCPLCTQIVSSVYKAESQDQLPEATDLRCDISFETVAITLCCFTALGIHSRSLCNTHLHSLPHISMVTCVCSLHCQVSWGGGGGAWGFTLAVTSCTVKLSIILGTLGPETTVLIIEVSSIQGLKMLCIKVLYSKYSIPVTCVHIRGVSQGSGLEGCLRGLDWRALCAVVCAVADWLW